MSREEKIDINLLLRDYALLQRYAENLSVTLSNILAELNELSLAKETISKLASQEKVEEALVSLDRSGYAYIKASISDTRNVLVNIGSNYYVIIDSSKAIEILEKRITELSSMKSRLEKELAAVTQKIGELKQIIAQVQTSASSKIQTQ